MKSVNEHIIRVLNDEIKNKNLNIDDIKRIFNTGFDGTPNEIQIQGEKIISIKYNVPEEIKY